MSFQFLWKENILRISRKMFLTGYARWSLTCFIFLFLFHVSNPESVFQSHHLVFEHLNFPSSSIKFNAFWFEIHSLLWVSFKIIILINNIYILINSIIITPMQIKNQYFFSIKGIIRILSLSLKKNLLEFTWDCNLQYIH